jgi:hypothetical protein
MMVKQPVACFADVAPPRDFLVDEPRDERRSCGP